MPIQSIGASFHPIIIEEQLKHHLLQPFSTSSSTFTTTTYNSGRRSDLLSITKAWLLEPKPFNLRYQPVASLTLLAARAIGVPMTPLSAPQQSQITNQVPSVSRCGQGFNLVTGSSSFETTQARIIIRSINRLEPAKHISPYLFCSSTPSSRTHPHQSKA